MAYSTYSLTSIAEQFGIRNQCKKLFEHIVPIAERSEWLLYHLQLLDELAVKSEKAK